MKINRLRLKGWIGIKKGLRLDEIDVDLSSVNGLVAISGQNGFGKTTFTESLSPYRVLASRNKPLRYHVFSRQSERELFFEYGGDEYRTLIKIDSDSDRSEGFVWKNGESQVDGKVTNYDRYIENLLGSANLFYASVFCAQNSSKLSDMTTGQLKQLFVEFLRLNRLEKYEATTKACINTLAGSSQQAERVIANLKYKVDGLACVQDDAERTKREITMATADKAAIHEAMVADGQRITALQDTIATNRLNQERLAEVKEEEAELRKRIADLHNESIEGELRLLETIEIMKAEMEPHRAVIGNKEAITRAADRAREIKDDISRVNAIIEQYGVNLEKAYDDDKANGTKVHDCRNAIHITQNNTALMDLDTEIDAVNNAINAIDNSVNTLKRDREEASQSFDMVRIDGDIKSCKETMALLEKRDPACTSTTCSFIVAGLKAKDRLEGLELEKKDLQRKIDEQINLCDVKISDNEKRKAEHFDHLQAAAWTYHKMKKGNDKVLSELKENLSTFESGQRITLETIEKLKSERESSRFLLNNELLPALERHQALSGQLPAIEKAEAEILRLSKEITAMEIRAIDRKDTYNRMALEDRSKLRKLEQRVQDIAKLINVDAETELGQARASLASNKDKMDQCIAKLDRLNQELAILETRLKEKAAAEKELVKAQEELGRITAEIAQWKYLQYACGKTGLQALEIDGVAPLITGYANDLLTTSFGPNFSVRLVTQDPETGREVLDIVVIRGDGSETKLENLSGGEKVWVLKALRLAMTLVSKEKSGRNFQTILADEEDGPLDSEKSMSFIGLYKSIMEVGGFNTCFFISHNPDVVAMADHKINFSSSGINVE